MSSIVGSVVGGVTTGAGTLLSPYVYFIGGTLSPQPATPNVPATGSPVTVNTPPYQGLTGTLVGVAYAADGTTPLMAMVNLPSLSFTLTLWGPFIKLTTS